MKTELVRITADWMAHATYGVNPRLLAATLYGDVTRAPAVTVYDETRHPAVARGQEPDTTPALCVTMTGAAGQRVGRLASPSYTGWDFELAIRYYTQKTDTQIAVHHESQVVRAIDAAFVALMASTSGDSAKTANNVQLVSATQGRSETYTSNDDTQISGAVIYTVRVHDVTALIP